MQEQSKGDDLPSLCVRVVAVVSGFYFRACELCPRSCASSLFGSCGVQTERGSTLVFVCQFECVSLMHLFIFAICS